MAISSFFFGTEGDRGDLTGEDGGDGNARIGEEAFDGTYAGGDKGDNDDGAGSGVFESLSAAFDDGGNRSTMMIGVEGGDVRADGVRVNGSGLRFWERKYLRWGIQPLCELCDLVCESVMLDISTSLDAFPALRRFSKLGMGGRRLVIFCRRRDLRWKDMQMRIPARHRYRS